MSELGITQLAHTSPQSSPQARLATDDFAVPAQRILLRILRASETGEGPLNFFMQPTQNTPSLSCRKQQHPPQKKQQQRILFDVAADIPR